MRKIYSAALAALMVLTLLGGCQLAVESDAAEEEGTLCGAFITLDYLNVDDNMELTINWKGEPEITFSEPHIYATRTKDDNGHPNYAFEGIEGYSFYLVQLNNLEGYGSYSMSKADGAIQNGSINITDESVSLSGTICFDVHADCGIYVNPVYQTTEGEVYMMPGSGLSFETIYEGDVGSSTLSTTSTETINGETTTRTAEVEIKITGCNTNQQVVLKQMDENDSVIARAEITSDHIPEAIRIQPDAAYMILEEHSIDREGKAAVKRTLLSVDENYFNVSFTGEHGIVEPYVVTLEH